MNRTRIASVLLRLDRAVPLRNRALVAMIAAQGLVLLGVAEGSLAWVACVLGFTIAGWIAERAWEHWQPLLDADGDGAPDALERLAARYGVPEADLHDVLRAVERYGVEAIRRALPPAVALLALALVGCGGAAQIVCPMGAAVEDVTARIVADDGSGASAHIEAHFLVCGLPLVVTTDATSNPPTVAACVVAPLVGEVCEAAP
jgi:hypothetical protein